jgi:hypothetical protein
VRRILAICFFSLALTLAASAAPGKVYKVLPQFLDQKGRTSLSPSLYDRDAYQAILRKDPAKRSGIQFAVEWQGPSVKSENLRLRVELRGIAEGDHQKTRVLETPVQRGFGMSHWTNLTLSGADYQAFGEVTAWRVTLWDGDQLQGEQKSFLWGD